MSRFIINSIPINKSEYFTWTQVVNKENYQSNLEICNSFIENIHESMAVEVSFYCSNGLIKATSYQLLACSSIPVDLGFLKDYTSDELIWVTCKSKSPYVNMYTVHTNMASYHTSGEHSF